MISAVFFIIVSEAYLARPVCSGGRGIQNRQNRFILSAIHGVLLYSLGAISVLLITEIGKQTVGRLRPHFLTVCKPDFEKLKCFEKINGVDVPRLDTQFNLTIYIKSYFYNQNLC